MSTIIQLSVIAVVQVLQRAVAEIEERFGGFHGLLFRPRSGSDLAFSASINQVFTVRITLLHNLSWCLQGLLLSSESKFFKLRHAWMYELGLGSMLQLKVNLWSGVWTNSVSARNGDVC